MPIILSVSESVLGAVDPIPSSKSISSTAKATHSLLAALATGASGSSMWDLARFPGLAANIFVGEVWWHGSFGRRLCPWLMVYWRFQKQKAQAPCAGCHGQGWYKTFESARETQKTVRFVLFEKTRENGAKKRSATELAR